MALSTKRRIVLLCVIPLIVLIIAVSGYLFLRSRGGAEIKAKQEYPLPENVVTYRQDDPAWAADKLGDSDFTMRSSGCLVSCIASAISMEKNEKITPGELNTLFSDNNVYDTEGNILWSGINSLDGYSADVLDGVSPDDIEKILNEGHYPIVRVKMNGTGKFHYVLIVGTENGSYICMDPLEDDLTKLSNYKNTVYAIRTVYVS